MPNVSDFVRYLKKPVSNDNERRSNANINSDNPMGAMLQFGASISKKEYLNDIPEKFSRAHNSGYIHIHDLDFYDLTTTCCQISLDGLFKTGFGNMRPPKRVQSAFMQLCIAIQSNQNDQYGGQSIIDYDIAMPRIIAKCFERNRVKYGFIQAETLTKEEVEQGCEAMVHNLNTMNSRAGAQVPFSSINYGLGPAVLKELHEEDASHWAEVLIQATFKATLRGLANGETARYPIQVYRIKKGVNILQEDPYSWLTKEALACTAKRAYPNYIFMDNANNDVGFSLDDPKTHVGTMGCRTRVFSDLFGPNTSYGRGNANFCTINLPRLGIISHSKSEFFARLSYTINLVADQLQYRLTRQSKRKPQAYPSLAGDLIGIDADRCIKAGNMWPMLRHFSLSVGFIGLYECVKALEMKGVQINGYDIVRYLQFKVFRLKANRKLNYSLLATPAEGLCERFLNLDREKFGVIADVTDKPYYTNSFHIPVTQEISVFDKLREEAKYHALCDAGHISYVELDGDAAANPEAMWMILNAMLQYGIGYGAYNVQLDHCEDCHNDGYLGETCPRCGSKRILRLRRVTGYLAYLERFNDGKKAEEKDRVYHQLNGG